MSRDREAEIESLRRENEQLRREVVRRREAGRARRFDDLPVASRVPERPAPAASTEQDVDRLAGRIEDAVSALCVELTAAVNASVRSATCKLDDLNTAIVEELPKRDREFNLKLEQLASEIQQLRLELAATRLRLGDASESDDLGNDAVAVSGIIIEQGEFRDHDGPRRWRRARRPWFYVPLVWGLILLVLVLAALLMIY